MRQTVAIFTIEATAVKRSREWQSGEIQRIKCRFAAPLLAQNDQAFADDVENLKQTQIIDKSNTEITKTKSICTFGMYRKLLASFPCKRAC